MIRAACHGDIPRIAELYEEAYQASGFATLGEIDIKEAKATVMRAIQRHGQAGEGGQCCYVAEQGGVVEGFIIGVLQRCYDVGVPLMASDLHFWVSPRGTARDAVNLATAYRDWGIANDKVVLVRASFTHWFADAERTTKLYESLGFHWAGGLFERSIER